MPVKKKTNKAPGQGMTAKQMKRRKPISQEYMLPIEPLTDCLLYTSPSPRDR